MSHDGQAMVWDGSTWVPMLVDAQGRVVLDQALGGGAASVAWGPDFGGPDGDQLSGGARISEVSAAMQFDSMVASKDSWYDTIGIPDTNHDGTPLQVEGVAATAKRAIIGWNATAQPSGSSVSVASVRLVVATPPTTLNVVVDVHLIPTGGEGWAEATISRTTAPATDGAAVASFTIVSAVNGGAAGDVHTITLNTTARTRLAANMGVRTFSLILTAPSVAATNTRLWDKDTGAAADKPTLTFSATRSLL